MIANYAKDPQLFECCMDLINEVFPGCKEFALKAMKYNASWSEASTPFIIEEKGEIIAHAGVLPITLMLNGKKHHTAAIHAVCVKPTYRGKGYFKQLMQEVMQYTKNTFDSSILFTTKPYLYKSYPYTAMLPEYDFIVSENIRSKAENADLRILNLDNTDDLNLIHHLLSTRIPLSNQFSVMGKNANTLFVFNTMHGSLYYSDKLNAIIVFETINNTLYIKEIISQKSHQLVDIIRLIPNTFDKVILQFCPDNFLEEKDYTPIMACPENCMMVSETFSFEGKYFRYPELYSC